MSGLPHVAYFADPRFSGGTSSAIAAELSVTTSLGKVSFHAAATKMFEGRALSPQLDAMLQQKRIDPVWDGKAVSGRVVIIHNPSFLKFEKNLEKQIIAKHIVVVSHENFMRPDGHEAFDVARCLELIDRNSVAVRKSVAPISTYNRQTVLEWDRCFGLPPGWDILPDDWFNICDFPMLAPTPNPRDRRGRHSRPGLEKFPDTQVLNHCFPPHAEANVILGADILLADGQSPAHWALHPFRSIDVAQYFDMIDFMVYFTAPGWRESFGRVLAEGIAAGKVVITDPGTAATFGDAVISAQPEDVDDIIATFLANPPSYTAHVHKAQAKLAEFSPDAFKTRFAELTGIDATEQVAA